MVNIFNSRLGFHLILDVNDYFTCDRYIHELLVIQKLTIQTDLSRKHFLYLQLYFALVYKHFIIH